MSTRTAGRRVRVAVVGAGFGGLGMAIALKRAGHHDFVVLDKAPGIGGVWRDNTYPGAACDVPASLYSYSFGPRHPWSRRYAPQPEILDYLRSCVETHGLGPHLRLGEEVTDAVFDDDRMLWHLRTAAGETIEAEVFVAACGQHSRPVVPRIPGAERFTGRAFHSARWDHGHSLSGRRVAVVGTGASALQIVPAIADEVEHLTVFQRSAPHVVPKWDRALPAPRLPGRVRDVRHKAARLGWWLFNESLVSGLTRRWPTVGLTRRGSEAQLSKQLTDDGLRTRLRPSTAIGCKRVGISSTYYPALQRSNVTLVTEPIAEMTETAIRTTDGTRHEVDTVVYATGFAATDFLGPLRVSGRRGADLARLWSDGARAHLGMTVPGFPNLFLVYGPNTNIGAGSAIYMIESQIRYIRAAVLELAKGTRAFLEVRPEVAEAFDTEMARRTRRSVWASCTSWYRHPSGRVTNNWPGQTVEYRRRTARLNLADFRPALPRQRRP
ncbi:MULTISPECIES: flavin-containing monooxygenase [unclassified Streptomyces]|uniref:NAD(P)/FAD-dependent oxidoreductase n=1 Tax=Streptomyces sp. NBC_00060 TaxID=2975636 RepID=A0AAU2GU35_9ACTN